MASVLVGLLVVEEKSTEVVQGTSQLVVVQIVESGVLAGK